VSPLAQLTFGDEQLTMLAAMAGEPAFPYARTPQLDDDGWEAVALGLVARGVLRADRSPAEDQTLDAALGLVLGASSSLRMTLVYAPGAGDSRHEVLWLEGDAAVRQTTTPDGVHRFLTGRRETVDELLALLLGFEAAGDSQPGAPITLAGAAYAEAVSLVHGEGAAVAAERHPAAADFVAALADARRLTDVEARRRDGDDRFEGDGLTLVESAGHGLWLVRHEAAVDGDPDAAVTLQRIAPDTARGLVAALVG
jgi:hypothetical protein